MKYLLLSFIYFLGSNVSAQSISKMYNFVDGNEIAKQLLIKDGKLFFLSLGIYDPLLPNNIDDGYTITILNEDYSIYKQQTFRVFPKFAESTALTQINDTIIIVGHNLSISPMQWHIKWTNMQLDSINEVVLKQFTDYTTFAVSIQSKDDNIYIAGRNQGNSDGVGEPFVLKMDANGTVLQEEKFHDIYLPTRYCASNSLVKTTDGHLAMAGKILWHGSDNIPGYSGSNHQPIIVKFTTDLDTLWSAHLPPYSSVQSRPKITPSLDGGVVGNTSIHPGDPGWLDRHHKYTYFPIITYKLDSEGTLVWTDTLWTNKMVDNGPGVLRKVLRLRTTRNGDILGVGSYEDPISNKTYASMYRYSGDGVLLWEKIYQDINLESKNDIFIDVAEADNGDLLVTGSFLDLNGEWNNATYAWLLRVDSNGCFEPECLMSDSTELIYVQSDLVSGVDDIKNSSTIKKELIVSPNPASSIISITLPQPKSGISWQVMDQRGARVLNGKEEGYGTFYDIDISSLHSSIYYVQVKDDSNEVYQVSKVVVSK